MSHPKNPAIVLLLLVLSAGCTPHRETLDLKPDPLSMISKVADRVLVDFPDPPDFNWGEGVLMVGMLRAGQVAGDDRYIRFVSEWADHWQARTLESVLEQRGYCGRWGPAFALLELHALLDRENDLTLAHTVASYMLREGTRTQEGGLGHWRGNKQLWADTLYMVCPLLAELGEVMHRDEFKAEATRQLMTALTHLQDPATGLCYHMYDEPSDAATRAFWGRGNGWIAMSFVEVMSRLDRDSAEYARLSTLFAKQAQGLIDTRDPNTGLWRTVLDRPESYEEISASAMILYTLYRGTEMGCFEGLAPEAIEESWAALASQVSPQGQVINVSTGTGPTDFETYQAVERGTYTWGTGAFLIAASALAGER